VRAAITARFTAKQIRAGQRATVVGRVAPDSSYQVQLQRRRHGWQTVDAASLHHPRFRLHAQPGHLGVARFRVRVKPTAFNGAGASRILVVRVRKA
jgi:hypothetical protein